MGEKNALDRARKEEMEKLGLSEDMLVMARECGKALERSIDGLKATRNSLESQRALARRLEKNADDFYEKAKKAMVNSDEDTARKALLDRERTQEKLKKSLAACIEETKRLEQMEENIEALEQRALEVESLLNRSVGTSALRDSSSTLTLPSEDPLLERFRDLGID